MKTIKVWEIPEHIPSLEHDGDKTDLRLHSDEMIDFDADCEKIYNQVTAKLDTLGAKGKGWEMYCSYDVSGFDYWHVKQEESTCAGISIAFDGDSIPFEEVAKIEAALEDTFYILQEDIQGTHCGEDCKEVCCK